MLKMTGIESELISDNDMHLFIEKGKRGGFPYIAKRFIKANNNTRNHMMLMNQVNILCIWMKIIYMIRQ